MQTGTDQFNGGMTYDEYVRAATNAQVDIMEADLTKLRNDWTKDKDGGGYKSYIGGQPGENAVAGGSVLDTDRGELEDFFGKLISEFGKLISEAKNGKIHRLIIEHTL
jgi:hypothetical protein